MTRRIFALLLILVGGAVALTGLGMALSGLIGLYASTAADPMGQPDGTEAATSKSMLKWAAIGALGAAPLAVGSVMLWIDFFRRLAGRSATMSAKAPGPTP
jgi:hypothetical protein